jgi:acetylornithine/succinyldiaminopimelate/putrescine aminotransferase/predicted amino acid dehydrogenase
MLDPHRRDLLRHFRLDRTYVRGEGSVLWDAEGGRVLDLTSQYGALPFGHNPPALWEALDAARRDGLPALTQPSRAPRAQALAERLSAAAPVGAEPGQGVVTFVQSGSEAVEAALRLARCATGRRRVLAAEGGYHGLTAGAAALTGRAGSACTEDVVRVPFGDAEALAAAFATGGAELAAFVVEPVQGEGGVHPASPAYLRLARRLCDAHGALLVLDEVQTGLGRTGALFAAEARGVRADVVTLAKALGGGLVPLAACVADRAVHTEAFGLGFGSTFADNNLTCAVGLAVFDALDAAALARVRVAGGRFGAGLRRLARACPGAARQVRGEGLLWGVELVPPAPDSSFLLTHLAAQGTWVGLCAAYLLNVHGVRVLPGFGRAPVLRLLPSLNASDAELDEGLAALEDLLETVERQDWSRLLRPLLGRAPGPRRDRRRLARPVIGSRPPRGGERPGRFAFLVHPTSPAAVVRTTPALADLRPAELRGLYRWSTARPGHAPVCHLPALRSPAGGLAEGWLVAVSLRPEDVGVRPQAALSAEVRAAVRAAQSLGADVVGLGAFTSIVTRNGRDLSDVPGCLTSGNALTVALAVDGVLAACAQAGVDPARASLAVVGLGVVGVAAAELLAPHVHQVALVPNPRRGARGAARARRVAGRLRPRSGSVRVRALAPALADAHVVVCASSAPGPLVFAEQLRSGAVVCDLARPSDVAAGVAQARSDVLLFDGGLARLPEPVAFGTHLGLPAGVSLACLAETALLALAGVRSGRVGVSSRRLLDDVRRVRALARDHGFGLDALARDRRPLPPSEPFTLADPADLAA